MNIRQKKSNASCLCDKFLVETQFRFVFSFFYIMAANDASLEHAVNRGCANISLEEEEEGGLIVVGDEEIDDGKERIDSRFCLVGRFLTDKVINFAAMKHTMASLWRPGKGVCIRDLSLTLFLFQFFHEINVKRVLESGPWTFDQHILLVKRLEENEQP